MDGQLTHIAHFCYDYFNRLPEKNRDERFWDCATAHSQRDDLNTFHLDIDTGDSQPFQIDRCYDLSFSLVPQEDDTYLLERHDS